MLHTAKTQPATFFAVCARLIGPEVKLTIEQTLPGNRVQATGQTYASCYQRFQAQLCPMPPIGPPARSFATHWLSCETIRKRAADLVVDATQALNRSAGVANRIVLRGRSLSCRATLLSWACEYTDRSVPFGKYCRSRPLVFSAGPEPAKSTYLAIAIARSCIRAGSRGRFYNVVDLVNRLGWPKMYRVRRPDGSLTDMVNLTRARGTQQGRWPVSESPWKLPTRRTPTLKGRTATARRLVTRATFERLLDLRGCCSPPRHGRDLLQPLRSEHDAL